MNVELQAMVRGGVCPNCLGARLEVNTARIRCPTCGLNGDPAVLRFCERVPCFAPYVPGVSYLAGGTQVYQRADRFYTLAGYAPGCGRVLQGDWCDYCREYAPPSPAEKVKRSRAVDSRRGKDEAAGRDE